MYRVITRFWWPYVVRDIINGVLGCATCRLANHNSHEAQMHLHACTCDEPFSTIFLDMWKPSDVPEKDGTQEVLTMMDGMTGFAAGAFLGKPITAEVLADVTFSQFFCVFGLPRIIVVDADSKFCGIFTKTFENLLGIHVEVVSRENHKAACNSNESSKSTQQKRDRSSSGNQASHLPSMDGMSDPLMEPTSQDR
jgi:hypothetical protein